MSAPSVPMRAMLAALLLPLVLAGCELTREERSRVNAWLECEDCTSHESDSVRAIGARWWRRFALTRALARDIRDGPPSSRTANVLSQLGGAWSRDRDFASLRPRPFGSPLPDSAAYVGYYLGNYVATSRIRAAMSIVQVAGVRALPPVDSSADSTIRDDVRAVVARLRASGHP